MVLKSLRCSSLRILYYAVIFSPRFAWMLFSLLLIVLSNRCLQQSLVHWIAPVISRMWAVASESIDMAWDGTQKCWNTRSRLPHQ